MSSTIDNNNPFTCIELELTALTQPPALVEPSPALSIQRPASSMQRNVVQPDENIRPSAFQVFRKRAHPAPNLGQESPQALKLSRVIRSEGSEAERVHRLATMRRPSAPIPGTMPPNAIIP